MLATATLLLVGLYLVAHAAFLRAPAAAPEGDTAEETSRSG